MEVAHNISHLPMPPTAPGQMHVLRAPVKVTAVPWRPPPATLDATRIIACPALVPASIDAPAALAAAPRTVADAQSPSIDLGILKIAGASADRVAAACPSHCHALSRTELHGDVVRWGADHLLEDAGACCEACRTHAAASSNHRKPCNVWVYCAVNATCGARYRQCWLKHAKAVWANEDLLVGTSDAWVSGTEDAAPEEHPSGAGRRLPTASSKGLIGLKFSSTNGNDRGGARQGMLIRVRLRDRALRATALVRSIADDEQKVDRAARSAGGGDSGVERLVERSRPCLHAAPHPAVLGASPVPINYGTNLLPDGLGTGQRWPRGAALIRATLGALLSAQGNRSAFSAVEPKPVAVLRGSVAWAAPGGDGPHFFVALADMPHLGVSHTVWGEVVDTDMPLLDAFAVDAGAGRETLPRELNVVRL